MSWCGESEKRGGETGKEGRRVGTQTGGSWLRQVRRFQCVEEGKKELEDELSLGNQSAETA